MTGDERVLAVSLATEPVVGSNLRGGVSGGGWLYALPRLDHRRIVCVGMPPMATIAALARAGTVTVVEPSHRRRGALERSLRAAGIEGVDVAAAAGDEPIDLLVAIGRRAVSTAQSTGLLDRLAPDGLAYLERAGRATPPAVGTGLRLALAPGFGEARTIVPSQDVAMRRSVRRRRLEGVPHGRVRLALLRGRVAGLISLRGRPQREAYVGRPGAAVSADVPAYLSAAATEAGLDLAGWRWAVVARGDYDSQKVLVLLAPPGAEEPTGVVKVTRSPVHAARLRNEGAALAAVAALPSGAGRAPVPWFAGEQAGRPFLGASLVEGTQYTEAATYSADDPLLRDALEWLTELAAASARPVSARAIAEALMALLERYERIYRPPAAELAALRERFERVGETEAPIPVVLQHGDPGIWNLLATPEGRTVFLDWEAAERSGMPLWDVLYFFRSYAVAESRRAGVRDRLEAASRHLLGASPLADRLVETIDAYRRRIALPAAVVEPLAFGCWIHRSLKEASRLPADRLDRGQFVRLIRRMVAEPGAPTLARLAVLPDDGEEGT